MIGFKIKLAVRNLLKNKVYSALIIGGFAIGFTACILIGLFYQTEHSVNKEFANHEQIYRLYDIKRGQFNMDYKLDLPLNNDYPEVKRACPMEYYENFEFTIKSPDNLKHARVRKVMVSSNQFFEMFSVEVLNSMGEKPFDRNEAIVISEGLAKTLFENENPLGRKIVHDYFSGIVTAVVKEIPENSTFGIDMVLNVENESFQMSTSCNNGKCFYPTNLFVQLNNAANAEKLTSKFNKTLKEYGTVTDSVGLQSLSSVYLSALPYKSGHRSGSPLLLSIFLGIGILIVILSSINYLNYNISIQQSRMKEIGVNKTNGAGLVQLLNNSIVEVAIGIFIALIISMAMVAMTLPYSDSLFGKQIFITQENIFNLLPIFAEVVLLIIMLNSVAPVYILSRFRITDFLKGGKFKEGKQIGKQVMLTFQFMVSIALIVSVFFIYKQLQFVKNYDLGFDEEQLVRLELPEHLANPVTMMEDVKQLPFVIGSTLSDGYPGGIKLRMGSNDENSFSLSCIRVGEDYLSTMGIDLKEGRSFKKSEGGRACILNQEAIRKFKWDKIQDKVYNSGSKGGYKVVGSVGDFNVSSLHNGINPVALLYEPEYHYESMTLRLAPGKVGEQLAHLREFWKTFLPEDPMFFTFYDDDFQAMYMKEEKLAKSISIFSFIALVLTCMGILVQIFLTSLHRIKEIGIRKVNGAKISEILTMLNIDFVKWLAIAFVLASPLAWYAMNKWLGGFAYQTNLSWWVFALAGILTLGLTLLTVSWHSWRAATRNPVEALRYE